MNLNRCFPLILIAVMLTSANYASAAARQIPFGIAGLAYGQTAKLTVVGYVNPAVNGLLPPGPCHASLALLDPHGNVISDAGGTPVFAEADLAPGESLSVRLNSRSLVSPGGRLGIHASVMLDSEVAIPPGPCDVFSAALEIIDNFTARTNVFLSPAELVGFNPQPDPPGQPIAFAPSAVAFGQIARLHVVGLAATATGIDPTIPPGPCHVQLGFYDRSGNPITDAKGQPVVLESDVQSTDSIRLDLPSLGLVAPGGRLAFLAQAVGSAPSGVPPGPCRAFTGSVEVLDMVTGRTEVVLNPALYPGLVTPPDPDRVGIISGPQ